MKTPDNIGTMIGRLIAKLWEKKIITTDEMIEILGVDREYFENALRLYHLQGLIEQEEQEEKQ